MVGRGGGAGINNRKECAGEDIRIVSSALPSTSRCRMRFAGEWVRYAATHWLQSPLPHPMHCRRVPGGGGLGQGGGGQRRSDPMAASPSPASRPHPQPWRVLPGALLLPGLWINIELAPPRRRQFTGWAGAREQAQAECSAEGSGSERAAESTRPHGRFLRGAQCE